LVICLNKEILGEEISNYVLNMSDIEMKVKHNDSGFSKDVDGQVKLLRIILTIEYT